MNEDKLRAIIFEFRPKNVLLNTSDYFDLLQGCHNYLDFRTANYVTLRGIVAYYLGSKLWIGGSVNINEIKIASGMTEDINEVEWSLPICLDWHLNDIRKMWSLKAFW